MSIVDILIGLATNAGYEKLFKDENASLMYGKLEHYLDKTTKEFFKKHKQYGYDHDSFLAREKNIELILKSMFYDKEIDLINEIDRRGFNNNPEISEEHLKEFLTLFYENCKTDFELSGMMHDKKFRRDTTNSLNKLGNDIGELLKQKALPKSEEKGWRVYDAETNEAIEFVEGKKYAFKHKNGLSQVLKVSGKIISYKQTTSSGETTYTDFDLETGTAYNIKPPFPWEEYSIVYDQGEEINKTRTTNWHDGSYKEDIELEFQRKCTAFYNSQGQLTGFEVSGGWSIIHAERKITPID
ncbi:hypothetical protein SFC11_01235 [Exiguobacterium indicum]|uniref:hypothetical protein n=1 Tax=Exiguobacterium indicum TaxID=296995 RepID=UPI0039820235